MDDRYLKEELEKINEKSNIKELKKYVNDMIEIRGFEKDTPQDIMLLLTEEIGELAKEIRKATNMKIDSKIKGNKTDVKGEIADIFIYILCMCRVMNINLVEAFKEKEERNLRRSWK